MITLPALLQLILSDYVVHGKRSISACRARVRHLSRLLPNVPTAEDLDQYILTRHQEGAAPATVRNELSILHHGFVLARRRGFLTDQQIPPIEMPRVDNVRTVTATPAQVRTLVAALDVLDPPVADLVRWLLWTGWRRGEAQGLVWEDFDEDLASVTLPSARSKTGRIRRIGLGEQMRLLVRRRWHLAQGPYVFHRSGRQIRSFSGAWHRAVAGAGSPDLRPHDLRRIFCQAALDAQVPIPVIQQIAGWKTLSMICRYGIASSQMQARAQDVVAAVFGEFG